MEKRLKIGITCYPTLGGSGVVATELGKMLAERGHEIHFITHSIPFRLGRFHRNIYFHEVEVSDYYVFKYPPYDLALANKLAQVAQMEKLDLLHVHYAIPHAVCALLAKQMVGDSLKVVTTLHGTDITVLGEDPSIRGLIQYAINQSDAVTAVSDDLIQETRKLLDITRPLELVYNFVDKRVFYPRDMKKLREEFADPNEKILLHMSNFRPVKRVMDVVDIFAKVNAQVPSRLLMVGDGPDIAGVMNRVEKLGLKDRVIFCGKQDAVADIISLSDLMLLPSEKESFGLVALEAMACGVPTVGSMAGGIPELVENGVSGFLSPIGDTASMAANAIRLLQDAELYERVSQACLHRARHTFCNDRISMEYEDIYYQVLSDTSPYPKGLPTGAGCTE
ncbi:N-acetyl-alpha-D-glucosaminyl L-malate synthase BshA [Gorillibacterium timonense]|uniref:N-acetyl-alpha-D-glucosaminyl L-malate synthase BshA n=1 Tax=Gorillibacterium timonense TaxID=1689269 RepID=UPI00071D60C5|nr:N-acetyl-alpha-D-glucosaminyl L-malate synthase BshA [Gorillibacterium timonense]